MKGPKRENYRPQQWQFGQGIHNDNYDEAFRKIPLTALINAAKIALTALINAAKIPLTALINAAIELGKLHGFTAIPVESTLSWNADLIQTKHLIYLLLTTTEQI
ncbi:hypothetical protein CHS0354_029571 [Potamilus streckersoni]|uniref:Uncharacterized protein n=1 Tax=Potamilus streckersoni TaxID=2493646 RepID=A0AAE0VZZ6_9BIVA|nr:hypothetical protein CHS0354_029571 [Potamilus streckersoni]